MKTLAKIIGICALSVIVFGLILSRAVSSPKDTVKTNTANSAPASKANNNDKLLTEVRKEEKVKEAIITDAGVLYVSVYSDGTLRDGYAKYLCQLKADYQTTVTRVKIVQFGTTNERNGYGVVLGEAWCK